MIYLVTIGPMVGFLIGIFVGYKFGHTHGKQEVYETFFSTCRVFKLDIVKTGDKEELDLNKN